MAQLVQDATQTEPPAAQPAVPPKSCRVGVERLGQSVGRRRQTQERAAKKIRVSASPSEARNPTRTIPASAMWKVVPVDDPADAPEIKATESPEPTGTKFGRFFSDSYLFRIFGAGRSPTSKEVNR